MAVRNWQGDRIARKVRGEERKRLARAAIVVSRYAKELLSVSGTTKSGGARDKKGRFLRQYGINPSAPGEPPHKQTGRLRMGVTWEPSSVGGNHSARVGPSGYSALYGKFLEKGTTRMAARPWLVRAFKGSYFKIYQILTADIR